MLDGLEEQEPPGVAGHEAVGHQGGVGNLGQLRLDTGGSDLSSGSTLFGYSELWSL